MKLGGISINYSEPDPATYKSVEAYIKVDGKEVAAKSFATGDANYDYHCGIIWLEGCDVIMGSSSCDHFQMDGGTVNLEVKGFKQCSLKLGKVECL